MKHLTYIIAGALAAEVRASDPYSKRSKQAANVLEALKDCGALSPVLAKVAVERARQDAKWGEQNHPDGTGPEETPLFASPATGVADDDSAQHLRDVFTGRTDWRFGGSGDRPGTWVDILLEEVFEALAESDAEKLIRELVQVAAVATQWVEAIERRVKDQAND